MKIIYACFLFCVLSTVSYATCDTPKHQEFDFWLGKWDVYTPQGKLAGTNHIQKIIGNCVLEEQYSTPSGYTGKSLNIYDATNNLWHQTWVDNSGLLLSLNGKFDGKSMVLSGPGVNRKGEPIQHQITWTLMPDKTVRQHWQISADKGASWNTIFDGKYVKK